ncbi:RNA-binding S4 domain-containing protein [Vibrio cincinnatiensis]|uniref:RNA-binding S4 domain-containing protein n=1 Tax=Vibrio cincinnatiensis TaxID=675 RepID=UPI001EDDFF29|nr:RNA-binding S4 domain-containing protein [Vibrio cincinnatiensis]MCG3734281.1 RNA-binding S4 domain-containing protein [Vibrio cincinnatiensis]MCG3737726.1 RNA-binding S4 domain-containing protein [Vibrio cincinnatiensis]MCG3741432.1 RNA-binding S4 domain-containing protein [Vibrio cincinnatiensis]MCG3745039.1 RNA-binding S4 domain-containing protein [Vibrio cincinnatiensis]MCG3747613.1 RNA-binding S4 domain-containing protein [Vibrio cincinnatiensis]
MNDHPEEVEIEAIGIEVDAQPIELYKVLKLANAVSGGGEAKYAIAEGYVAVNGELETRKRRKLYDGDLVEFNQEYYLVICDVPLTVSAPIEQKKSEPTVNKKKASSSPMKKKGKEGKANPMTKGSARGSQNKNKEKNTAGVEGPENNTSPASKGGRSAIRFF